MTTIGVAETLIKANNIKNTNDRVRFLQQNKNNRTMLILLQMAFSPNIKFALPDGPTPYTPLPPEFPDNEGRLYGETRRLYLFVEGGFAGKINNSLKQDRREVLWVQLLESMDANDAALLDAVKDGKTPYKGITAVVVRKAFPGLLPAAVKKTAVKKTATKKTAAKKKAVKKAVD